MIPKVEPCRFMTIAQIRQNVLNDDFEYNSVRVVAKVKNVTPQSYKLVAEDPNDASQIISIDYFLLKGRQIEKGKIYEFLGEVEQIKKSITNDRDNVIGANQRPNNATSN